MRYTNSFTTKFTPGAFLFLLVVALGQNARAQDTGSVRGTVTELMCPGPHVEAAAGVIVLVDDLGLITQTDDNGFYGFDDVPPGRYNMSFFQLGDRWARDEYFVQARSPVSVVAGRTTTVNVQLPFEVRGEIAVRVVDGTTRDDVQALADSYGLTLLEYYYGIALYLVPEWAFLDDYIPCCSRSPWCSMPNPMATTVRTEVANN